MYAISVIVSANCISAFSGNRRVLRSSNSRWPEQAGMQRVPMTWWAVHSLPVRTEASPSAMNFNMVSIRLESEFHEIDNR